jgi:hypothetical protein
MIIHFASPMFVAGGVLLGLSLTMFMAAFVATLD